MSIHEDPSTWRLSTPGGIPYKYKEGATGRLSYETASTQITVLIQASRLEDFANELFPVPTVFGGTIFYPRRLSFAGLPSLTVQEMNWKGLTGSKPIDPFAADGGASVGTYEGFLEVTVDFGVSPENDQQPNPNDPRTFLEISANASGEYLAAAVHGGSGSVRWDSVGGDEVKEIDVMEKVTLVLTDWTARWPQIPHAFWQSTLMDRLRGLMGKVNNSTMSLFYDAPAETILFMGYSLSYDYTWRRGFTGASPIELELKFLEKNFEASDGTQVTHNHEFRPGVGWRKLLIDGNNMYAEDDLDGMFDP